MEAADYNRDEDQTIDPKLLTEQEVVKLLATLVRSHYLEKSTKFQMAMDFEKLFKLDSLEQLKNLEELDKLQSLDQLQSLDHLKELSKLRELSHLSELKPLVHLDKLDELRELSKLDRLTSLYHLDKLAELQSLDNLKELDKLQSIHILTKLLDQHKTTLGPLVHLEKLMELVRLNELDKLEKLEQLSSLEKLESLNKLDKLDRIDDAKFVERLNKLDKLDILEKGTKTLVVQQVIGFGLEILKLALAGFVIVFLLSRETGREIAVKTLPALGFGSGAQVNLGLKLLVGETTPESFQSIASDVRKRMNSEIDTVFSTSSSLTLKRRLELIEQIKSYAFQGGGLDLSAEATKTLNEKLMKLHENAASRIEFDLSLARGKNDTVTENKLREIKLLLIQKQYPELLEKVLPIWRESEAITMATVAAVIALKLEDSGTLEDLLRAMPGNGAY